MHTVMNAHTSMEYCIIVMTLFSKCFDFNLEMLDYLFIYLFIYLFFYVAVQTVDIACH